MIADLGRIALDELRGQLDRMRTERDLLRVEQGEMRGRLQHANSETRRAAMWARHFQRAARLQAHRTWKQRVRARTAETERDEARAEARRLADELEKKRALLGHALSVPTLGDARAEIGGLRTELEMHQRGAKEARRQDDERHAAVTRELAEARAALGRVATVKVWTNEDGKEFLFADDVRAALGGGQT